jgi:hypothetical protein
MAKISPASRKGKEKPRELHSTASQERPSGSVRACLQTVGEPGLEVTQGLLVCHSASARRQSKARIFAISSVGSTGLTM